MDGKRIRVNTIFKSLVGIMAEAGYERDAIQLQHKYKNLKAEYYKAKRAQGVSGACATDYEYFEVMQDLLGNRPATQLSGFDSTQPESEATDEVIEFNNFEDVENLISGNITIDDYEDVPDSDGAQPGGSKDNCAILNTPSRSISKKPHKKKLEMETAIHNTMQDTLNCIQHMQKNNEEFINNLFKKQETLFMNSTKMFIRELGKLFQNELSDSDCESN